ncbi:MAG: hypothetical protein CL878_08465 [Dehalococcoidia bacterium]|nr:hypothetical protein [Dehalococcoidia bacterium]
MPIHLQSVVIGMAGLVDGAIVGNQGPTEMMELVFTVFAGLASLWAIVLSVLIWRSRAQA